MGLDGSSNASVVGRDDLAGVAPVHLTKGCSRCRRPAGAQEQGYPLAAELAGRALRPLTAWFCARLPPCCAGCGRGGERGNGSTLIPRTGQHLSQLPWPGPHLVAIVLLGVVRGSHHHSSRAALRGGRGSTAPLVHGPEAPRCHAAACAPAPPSSMPALRLPPGLLASPTGARPWPQTAWAPAPRRGALAPPGWQTRPRRSWQTPASGAARHSLRRVGMTSRGAALSRATASRPASSTTTCKPHARRCGSRSAAHVLPGTLPSSGKL